MASLWHKQENKLLADERFEEMQAKIAKLAGRKVNWRIKVQSVGDKAVKLEYYQDGMVRVWKAEK